MSRFTWVTCCALTLTSGQCFKSCQESRTMILKVFSLNPTDVMRIIFWLSNDFQIVFIETTNVSGASRHYCYSVTSLSTWSPISWRGEKSHLNIRQGMEILCILLFNERPHFKFLMCVVVFQWILASTVFKWVMQKKSPGSLSESWNTSQKIQTFDQTRCSDALSVHSIVWSQALTVSGTVLQVSHQQPKKSLGSRSFFCGRSAVQSVRAERLDWWFGSVGVNSQMRKVRYRAAIWDAEMLLRPQVRGSCPSHQ